MFRQNKRVITDSRVRNSYGKVFKIMDNFKRFFGFNREEAKSVVNENAESNLKHEDREGTPLLTNTTSSSLPNDESDKSSATSHPDIDGAWAWIIVASKALAFFIIVGSREAVGFIYQAFLNQYGESAIFTTWVISMKDSLDQILGLVAGYLCVRFGNRMIGIIGGIISFIGWLMSAIAPSLLCQILTFSLLIGFGNALIITACFGAIAEYFHKRRATANAVVVGIFGFGPLVIGPLFQMLFIEYDFKSAMFIIGALHLNFCVSGAVLRPLNPNIHSEKICTEATSSDSRTRFDEPTTEAKPINDGSPGDVKPIKLSIWERISESLDLKLLLDPKFTSCCIFMAAFYLLTQVKATFLAELSDEMGFSNTQIQHIFFGFTLSSPLRIVIGIIFDIPSMWKYRANTLSITGILTGILIILTPLSMQHSAPFGIAILIIGQTFSGVFASLQYTILMDTVEKHRVTRAIAMARFTCGVGVTLGCFGGLLKDVTGTYATSYYLVGLIMSISGVVFLCICLTNTPGKKGGVV